MKEYVFKDAGNNEKVVVAEDLSEALESFAGQGSVTLIAVNEPKAGEAVPKKMVPLAKKPKKKKLA